MRKTAVPLWHATIEKADKKSFNLSNGYLKIRYRSAEAVDQFIITFEREDKAPEGVYIISKEVFTRLPATADGTAGEITIPLPTALGLRYVSQLVLHGDEPGNAKSVDLAIEGLAFRPQR